jgi:hypothetical protein
VPTNEGTQQFHQIAGDYLVRRPGRRSHEKLSVDDFVAIAVVGEPGEFRVAPPAPGGMRCHVLLLRVWQKRCV